MISYILPFLVALTVLVFVHEFGHYWVARRAGVRVEVFSIGFGPELFGWTAKSGTRWRFSAIPLGGYVKMFGDMNPASVGARDDLTPEERKVAFQHKSLPRRAAIVAAGPIANFLFAIAILAGLFMVAGQSVTEPLVGSVIAGSAAEKAGIQSGDRIVSLDGDQIERFDQIQRYVYSRPAQAVDIGVERGGSVLVLKAVTGQTVLTDRFGNVQQIGQLGIGNGGQRTVTMDPVTAVVRAVEETGVMISETFRGLGEMISGRRDTSQIGGILSIGKMSGEVAQDGFVQFLSFLAMLSINLGFINLLPIPVLDGGHLLFYAGEAIYRRPLPKRLQEAGAMAGFAAIVSLMLFATWNDLVKLRIVSWVSGLIG
ncbi:RIP metalloprotease RseP [Lacibacterium aquatile]|uniref:Zinc metalloprotease n=1 Tax=Lacibacterium aquatile TaxID=1168082 RepID=A0ABW5DK13_9PROT